LNAESFFPFRRSRKPKFDDVSPKKTSLAFSKLFSYAIRVKNATFKESFKTIKEDDSTFSG
jgi:hypothetical protein